MDFYQVVQKAHKTGKVDKGSNEVTKAIERGVAKLVLYAADVNPKEIVAHLSALCHDKGIPCHEVDSKQKLGAAIGLPVPTSAIAIIDGGEAEQELAQLKVGKATHGKTAAKS